MKSRLYNILRHHSPIVLLLIALTSAAELRAQFPSAQQQAPDCVRYFSFDSSGGAQNGATLANYGAGTSDGPNLCTVWQFAYAVSVSSGGMVTSLTIRVESADPGITSNVAGTFGAYAGTALVGSVSNTSTTGAQALLENGTVSIPFVRVALTAITMGSGTARVYGILQGWNAGNGSAIVTAAIVGSGCPNPCPVIGPTAAGSPAVNPPVLVAGQAGTAVMPGNIHTIITDTNGNIDPAGLATAQADGSSNTPNVPSASGAAATQPVYPYRFNGSTWDREQSCPNSASITFSAASGTLEIVALTASQIVFVCSIDLSSDTATNITLQYGTGSNCGTGTTSISGALQNVLSWSHNWGPEAALRTAASNAFCVTSSVAATIGGVITYAKH